MIEREELERMYLVEHLTLAQIGVKLVISRQGAHYWMRRYGVDTSRAERFDAVCSVCGKSYEITRKRYMKSVGHFCSSACYVEYMRNPGYRQWRTGQRIARIEMEVHLDRRLRPGEVVHHVDGDNRNNDISNLKLFNSASEHAKFHREQRRNG